MLKDYLRPVVRVFDQQGFRACSLIQFSIGGDECQARQTNCRRSALLKVLTSSRILSSA